MQEEGEFLGSVLIDGNGQKWKKMKLLEYPGNYFG